MVVSEERVERVLKELPGYTEEFVGEDGRKYRLVRLLRGIRLTVLK